MMIKFVLFDLDGTLASMDQDIFTKAYMSALAEKMLPLGYQPEEFVSAVWQGTKAMVKNDGKDTNENVFWARFCEIYGEECKKHLPVFEDFYRNEFDNVRKVCNVDPNAVKAVAHIKSKGLRVGLATNPLFPVIATEARIRWAGFEPDDFEFFTTYENSHYCKPNPKYYMEITERYGLDPNECLMVGNDATEDMIAKELGMKVFLLTDHLLNRDNCDISSYPKGNFNDLIDYVNKI